MSAPDPPATNSTTPDDRLLCLTILGYRKPGMSEEAYRKHMIEHSAPLTKDLMVKYGILRWTVVRKVLTESKIHNPTETRELMYEIMDPQMANIADYDCFSQVVFRNFEDYKKIKDDPWYKEHLVGDHENFADTKRSKMTIGWITQFIDRGVITEGFEGFPGPKKQSTNLVFRIKLSVVSLSTSQYSIIMASLTILKNPAIVTGSFLSGAVITLSTITVPVLPETSTHPPQLRRQWVRTYYYRHISLPSISVVTAILYFYIAACQGARKQPWRKAALGGLLTIMVPFTWVVMCATNGLLFEFGGWERDYRQLIEQSAGRSGLAGSNTSQRVRGLLVCWKWMYLIRSCLH
ncbi:EthD domain-containing protein [Aspergillus navahoensis]